MPIDYTIAAIPTVYNGIRYRSRLEARWAAMFDQLGWEAIYEPVDLGTWSPDFQIRKAHGNASGLVEVKPITQFDAEIAQKMTDAVIASNFDGALLLLGIAPFIDRAGMSIGWLGSGRHPPLSNGSVSAHWWHASPRSDISGAWARACNAVQWRP